MAMSIAGFNVYAKNHEDTLDDSSILLAFLGGEEETLETVTNNLDRKKSGKEKDRFSIVSVASATANTQASLTTSTVSTNSQATRDKKQDLVLVGENTLVKNSPTDTTVSYKPRTDVFRYTVKEGETITAIAKKFGIDAATILKESGKYADDIIKPGEKLTILPVSGTTERVDKGETLSRIAKKHGTDAAKIMDYNKLINASDIEEGQVLIIPDGKREIKMRPRPEVQEPNRTQLASRTRSTSSTSSRTTTPTVNKGSRVGNRFSYGWCTWYAAQKRGDVTWRGNAGQWLNNARAQGRSTGRIPAKGAILVTSESWWGHVAIVESVQGDRVTISEMNYKGFGVTSTRTISNRSGVIKGYIY